LLIAYRLIYFFRVFLTRRFQAVYHTGLHSLIARNPPLTSLHDVEIFYQLSGKLPIPVYDTQLVAPLLGFQENTGYAMLVSGFLNINLSKIHTRTDWSQRVFCSG
jgi:hypothetical protein